MASSTLPKPNPVRKLNELLKEQQEPFSLNTYLLERGYSMKRSKSLGSHDSKTVKRISQFSKILKSVVEKIVYANTKSNTKAFQDRMLSVSMNGGNTHDVAELDPFSSGSSLTSSESDILSLQQRTTSQVGEVGNLRNQQTSTTRHQWELIEDSKQSSPVSVLEELPTNGVFSFHSHQGFCSRRKKVTEDLIFSASVTDLLAHSLLENQETIALTGLKDHGGKTTLQYVRNKRVLQGTKQLLFDCVREVLETHRRARRKQNVYELLGAEELGKIICEQVFLWGKLSGNVANITQLIRRKFSESLEEWNDVQLQTREIGMEIGDAIFEGIREEIVTDIIDSFTIKRC